MSFGTYVKVSGAWKSVLNIWVRRTGVWKSIPIAFAKVSGQWKQVFGVALTASASPTAASGTGSPGATVVTNSVVVTPTGGLSPYAHNWTFLSGDSAIYPVAPTNNQTQVWARGTPGGGSASFSAAWQDTITDSLGQTFAISIPISIST